MSQRQAGTVAVDFDAQAYGELFERSYREMLAVTASAAEKSGGALLPGAVAAAVSAAALRVAAFAALGHAVDLNDLFDMLAAEFGDLAETVGAVQAVPRRLHS